MSLAYIVISLAHGTYSVILEERARCTVECNWEAHANATQAKLEILIPTRTAPETFSRDGSHLLLLSKLDQNGITIVRLHYKIELVNQAFVDRRCIIHHLLHHHHHEAAPPLRFFLQQSCIDAPLRFRPSLPLVLSLLCR